MSSRSFISHKRRYTNLHRLLSHLTSSMDSSIRKQKVEVSLTRLVDWMNISIRATCYYETRFRTDCKELLRTTGVRIKSMQRFEDYENPTSSVLTLSLNLLTFQVPSTEGLTLGHLHTPREKESERERHENVSVCV